MVRAIIYNLLNLELSNSYNIFTIMLHSFLFCKIKSITFTDTWVKVFFKGIKYPETKAGCSLGIGDQRILRLLHRILRLNFACFLRELCPSIIIPLLLYSILLLLEFLMETLKRYSIMSKQ